MARHPGVTLAGPLEARLIAGGKSNLTFAVTDGASRWVLRRPPLGGHTPRRTTWDASSG
ncbi:phosphotransferase [Nocardioides zeae]